MSDLVVRGATVVSPGLPPRVADVHVVGSRIAAVGRAPARADVEIDAAGCLVVPGLVQAHVHLCQTLFRGLADDLDVVEWLRQWIWPLEQAHDHASLRASADLSVAELLLGGTTCVLSMETVAHTDAAFEAAEELGIRAFVGKAIMDRFEPGTDMIGEGTEEAWADVLRLVERWDGVDEGRLRYALSPRAPVSGSDEMWRRCVALAEARDLVLHTHVDENRDQARHVAASGQRGRDVVELARLGALGPRLVMAHSVWLDDEERALVAERRPHVCHCPSANLKLASGRAPIPQYLAGGVNVALGADGAPCNNRLDAFTEMRLAALVHKPAEGASSMGAAEVFEMATLGGARALGLGDQLGAVEPGRLADLVVVDRSGVHVRPRHGTDPVSALVYAHRADDVRDVIVAGRPVVRDRRLLTGDVDAIAAEAERQQAALLARAGRGAPPTKVGP